jgi:hypothetical protein
MEEIVHWDSFFWGGGASERKERFEGEREKNG